jgi:hypothetical protein
MKITWHRTVSVFQRYRIVSDDDVRTALERTEAALGRIADHDVSTLEPGHNSGHSSASEEREGGGNGA